MDGQLSLLDLLDEQPEDLASGEDLFEPDGRRRCPSCRRRLAFWGGRLYCLHVGCGGAS